MTAGFPCPPQPNEEKVSVSAVVVTRNRSAALRSLLASLSAQTRPPDETVVVDNASTDDTLAMLAREFPGVRVAIQKRNLGCPGGRNVGIEASRGDIIISLDDDASCPPDTVARFVAAVRAHPRAAVIAARIVDPLTGVSTVSADTPVHQAFTFSGGAAALRRAALDDVGLYPAHFHRQAEELDLAWRLWDHGWEVIRDTNIVVYHDVGRFAPRAARFQTRNEILVAFRNLPLFHAIMSALRKSLTYPPRYIRRRAGLWSLVGAAEGWLKCVGELGRRRPVRRETIMVCHRLHRSSSAPRCRPLPPGRSTTAEPENE